MRRFLLVFLLVLAGFVPASPQNCIDCHLCKRPKPADPCLRACTRDTHEPNWQDLSQFSYPDTVSLDKLVEHYGAVRFNHKAHAEMSGMGGNTCRLCHHKNPEGKIENCSNCHPLERAEGGEEIVDLKTAYHRQCIFCHSEWDGETNCEICHQPLDESGHVVGDNAVLPSHMHRKARPVIDFKTDHQPAPYVTFHHKEHAKDYGISCSVCHELDNCTSCHLGTRKNVSPKLHDFSNKSTCSECHGMSHCGSCHSRKPTRVFKHGYTGFPLKRYHQGVACRDCHGEKHAHGQLPTDCQGCHNSDWGDTDTFDHAGIIGVDLGEDHEGMDCGDCHQDPDFQKPPLCSDCHDDGRGPDLLK